MASRIHAIYFITYKSITWHYCLIKHLLHTAVMLSLRFILQSAMVVRYAVVVKEYIVQLLPALLPDVMLLPQ